MANHASVYKCKKEFTGDSVNQLIETFMKEKGLDKVFKLDYESKPPKGHYGHEQGEGGWAIDYDGEDEDYKGYIGLNVWIVVDTSDEEWEGHGRHIEFRHGHSTDLMWWIDFALENYLAHHLEGVIIDDGDGEDRDPVIDKYPNLMDYFMRHCTQGSGKITKDMIEVWYDEEKNRMPNDLATACY